MQQQQPLIFTERRLLPRLVDIFLTVIAWIGFLWLIYDGVVKTILNHADIGPRPLVSTMQTLTLYLVVAALYGGILILWARYNQYRFRVERRTRKPAMEEDELAQSFKITRELTCELNKARVLTVHHDEHGDICKVDVRIGIPDNTLPERLPPEETACDERAEHPKA